jgi:hypothetical protein
MSQASPVQVNFGKPTAAELYLVEQYNRHDGEPLARRNEIFRAFIALGLRGRWSYHSRAEHCSFSDEEVEILRACRSSREWEIADWVKHDPKLRIVFDLRSGVTRLDMQQQKWCSGWVGDDGDFVCRDLDALPERVYSLSTFDDPEDVAEARQQEDADQSLWVSGVYWVVDNQQMKIVWVDEFGETIREKVCDDGGAEEGADAFDDGRPFESSWWTEATKVGWYATQGWKAPS